MAIEAVSNSFGPSVPERLNHPSTNLRLLCVVETDVCFRAVPIFRIFEGLLQLFYRFRGQRLDGGVCEANPARRDNPMSGHNSRSLA